MAKGVKAVFWVQTLPSALPLVERICVGLWWGGRHFSRRRLIWVFQLLSQNCRHAATFLSNRYLSMGYVLRIKNQLTETHRPQSATFRLWSRCVSSCVLSATRQAIEVVVCGEMLRRYGFFLRGVEWKIATWIRSLRRHFQATTDICTVGSGSGCWGATPKFFSFLKNLRYFISTTVWQYLPFIAKLYL